MTARPADMSADTPYLGRCKDCAYALFATPDTVKDADNFSYVKKGEGAFRVGNNGVFARCTEGHKFFKLNRIKGTYSKDHKCDARCLNAKGHNCTCSCGGLNHGRGFAVEVSTGPAIVTSQIDADGITEKQEAFLRTLLDERIIPDLEVMSGEERRVSAHCLLDDKKITKRQASKTIEWLLSLDKKEES